ncbi:TadE/TadG family type IV pilus assembly protein [Erythrobacter ani]|uniref:Pilus assembly protein n=1 Tax=Erythrobacter ani TaxID=2827235 RepID=A0ABS6SPR2_9SPHN|nr:TadE/TadG family type IV pilus assembly protein [Erythrobacter ani]MBV7267025.1 pilus assembly protein [Erythrobacter ani]
MIGNIRANFRARLRRIKCDSAGATAVEFGLLAPIFFLMLLGVIQTGVYLQNYNAVQSLASDGARYVMIEYQKNNALTDEQIRSVLLGEAVNAPYLLDTDRLNITVDRTGTSRLSGATEIDITLDYTLNDFVPIDMPGTTINYSRPVWVVPPPATGT